MYLGMMVLIWAPLSKRTIQPSPFILSLATFLPHANAERGLDSRRESVGGALCLKSLHLGALQCIGWAPFFDAIPSLPFNCFFSLEVFTWGQLQMKCSVLLQW